MKEGNNETKNNEINIEKNWIYKKKLENIFLKG